MCFIDFLNNVASRVDLSSDDSFYFRIGIVARFGANIHFGLLSVFSSNANKISVGDRPDSFVLLIVDSKDIFFFVEDF